MADKISFSSTELNQPVSIEKTPQIPWSESAQSVGNFSSIPVVLKESRFLFELKVLGTFLKEILAHPRTTSRVSVDSQRRAVVVERD